MSKKIILKKGDTVGIIACSNSVLIDKEYIINNLEKVFYELGLKVKIATTLYAKEDVLNKVQKKKALDLINFFKNNEIKAIFDVSGGDLANGLLEYIDFDIIKNNSKPFFGYSDLTVILNSIYSQSGINTYLYQVKNLIVNKDREQIFNFVETFINGKDNIYEF
ncbi:MAG: LD-carboxypeptidase, partial [Sarcina sp.]